MHTTSDFRFSRQTKVKIWKLTKIFRYLVLLYDWQEKKNVSKKSTFYNTIPILNSVFLLIIVVDQTKWPNQILKSKSNINLLCLKINEKLLCLWFKWVYWVLYSIHTSHKYLNCVQQKIPKQCFQSLKN